MKKKEKKQKIKKERKPMSNTNKFMLVFLATLIIYLAIMLPIRLCVVSFSWHWFVFGLIAVIIPFAFIHFQLWSQKKLSFTEAQKKNANVVTVKYILYFWFLDCLYMVIFNQWILWIYILGIITLIKIFYGLAVTFLGKKQKNAILDLSIVFDFLLGVGLTVYLIYLIPDKFNGLQTIVTAIVTAVYGGLLTLVGVAWTIKKGDKDRKEDLERHDRERKEEEQKKYTPVAVSYNGEMPDKHLILNCNTFEESCNIRIQRNDRCQFAYEINDFMLQNMDFSSFYIEGLLFNKSYLFYRHANLYVAKDSIMLFTFNKQKLYVCEKITSLYVLVKDMLNNEHIIELGYNTKSMNENNEFELTITGSKGIVLYREE